MIEQKTIDSQRVTHSLSLRQKLLLVAVLVFLPAFAIVVFSGLKLRRDEIAKLRTNADLVVQNLAAQQEQIATSTKVLLAIVAQLPPVQHLDAAACNRLFRELQDQFPIYSAVLAAATPDGKMFAASKAFAPGSVDLSDRKHFKDAMRTRDLAAGEAVQGRVSGIQSLNYAFPVLDPQHKPIGVVIAGFRLDEYDRLVEKADLPAGYTVTIADWQGIRLFRTPAGGAETAPGTPIPRDSLTLSSSSDRGMFERKGPDGEDRIYVFRQLRLKEHLAPYLYIVVGAPKMEILRDANMQLIINLSILGVTVGLVLFLTLYFSDENL